MARWAKQERPQDILENEKTCPPLDESIRLHCLWAAEIYTPSHIDSLLKGFRDLGWSDHPDESRDPAKFATKGRRTSVGGSWFNLGYIERVQKQPNFGFPRTAPLPEFAEYATAQMFTVTGSLTCVVMCFVCREDVATSFEAALRLSRRTSRKRAGKGNGYFVYGPRLQKRGAITAIRSDLRRQASNWFRTHLPGLFTSPSSNSDIPASEFTTLTLATPSARENEYVDLLGLGREYDAWRFEALAGVEFFESLRTPDDLPCFSVIAANESQLSEADYHSYGGRNRDGYVNRITDYASPLMAGYALWTAIIEFERRISEVRDSALLTSANRRRSLSLIEEVSKAFLQNIDAVSIAATLRGDDAIRGWFGHEMPRLTPLETKHHSGTFAENLSNSVAARAQRLQEAERILRDLLLQRSTLLSATENIALQARVGVLTWVLVVLTVVILLLTAVIALEPTETFIKRFLPSLLL